MPGKKRFEKLTEEERQALKIAWVNQTLKELREDGDETFVDELVNVANDECRVPTSLEERVRFYGFLGLGGYLDLDVAQILVTL